MAVLRLEIKTHKPLADAREFGDVGRYQQLDGTAHFAVDPGHLLNCAITDIDLAERGRDGLVHFTSDIRILAPVDQARGNQRLLFDVPNRGNRLALATFNGVPRPINPAAPTDAGNGFLMRQGYTVVWCGWQHDVPEADGLMRVKVPEAQIDGLPVSGRLLVGFQPGELSRVQQVSDCCRHASASRAPVDHERRVAGALDGEEAPPRTIPRHSWSFARLEAGRVVTDPNHVYLAAGFEPGRIYEVIYTTTGAPVIGLGLLAARDLVSFLRADRSADNPCARNIRHAYAFGASQSGRFLRQLLYLGFNEDETAQIVFDGVLVHIAGGKRGGDFNMRFGQPSASLPSDPFPFNEMAVTDPVSGRHDGLLERLAARHRVPKILFTNTSCEYWRGDASLIHTDASGNERRRADCFIALLPFRRRATLRRYLAADRHQPAKRRTRPASTQFGRLQPAFTRSAGADGSLGQRERGAAAEPLPTPCRRQRCCAGKSEGRRHGHSPRGVPGASAAGHASRFRPGGCARDRHNTAAEGG